MRLLKETLERAGFSVATTTKKHGLLDRAKAEQPDLIVLDIHWRKHERTPPLDLHGCEIALAMRAEPRLAAAPLVLLAVKSAGLPPGGESLGPGMVRWCQDLPPDAATYLFKPFCPDELVSLVHRLLPDAPGRRDQAVRGSEWAVSGLSRPPFGVRQLAVALGQAACCRRLALAPGRAGTVSHPAGASSLGKSGSKLPHSKGAAARPETRPLGPTSRMETNLGRASQSSRHSLGGRRST
jgi:CheY-like chemotaxis protein